MYHPFIEAAAMTLVDIPITLATLTAYCILVYFIVGLQASASQFLYVIPGSFFPRSLNSHFGGSIFFLLVFTIALIMKAYFRAIAAWFTDPTPAQSVAGVSLLILTLYTGYNIPEPYMVGALHWITYINVCASFHVHCTGRLVTDISL